ncbi:MAG: glycosyltransferase, partial [Planctomycetota bacterium]|nr:glycosyltransferase [Planctomycetota bacterium]
LDALPVGTAQSHTCVERAEGSPSSVAYVVHTFHLGGLERCVARLVNHLDPLRFRPMIICLNHSGDAANWIERRDVPIVSLRKAAGNDPRVVWRLAGELRRQRIDLVHSHNWGTLLETVLARKLARVPVHVHAEHGMELADLEQRGWRSRARSRVTHWALKQADAVVAVADSVRQRIEQRCGYPADQIAVIPNGVERPPGNPSTAETDRLKASLGIGKHAFVLGTIGRLAAVKAIDMAIDVVAMLAQQDRDVHLIVVGEGPEESFLLRHASSRGVAQRVHVVGPTHNVGPWLDVFNIYVNSSLSEGMNLAILEAMAAGLPSVVTDVGANALLVGGDDACGQVVPVGDRLAMVSAIASLINDTERLRRMSHNALRRHGSLYATEVMVNNYLSIYDSAITRVGHNGKDHG